MMIEINDGQQKSETIFWEKQLNRPTLGGGGGSWCKFLHRLNCLVHKECIYIYIEYKEYSIFSEFNNCDNFKFVYIEKFTIYFLLLLYFLHLLLGEFDWE